MTETAEAIKIQRGLKGVYFDRSPCTFIDGRAGELRYRGQGHAIEVTLADPRAGDWAARTRASFEERYRALYGRIEPAGEIEVGTWQVVLPEETGPTRAAAREAPIPRLGG